MKHYMFHPECDLVYFLIKYALLSTWKKGACAAEANTYFADS